MKTKIIISLLALGVIWGGYMLLTQNATPLVGTELAVAQVNGGNAEWTEMHLFQQARPVIETVAWPFVISAFALWGIWYKKFLKLMSGG